MLVYFSFNVYDQPPLLNISTMKILNLRPTFEYDVDNMVPLVLLFVSAKYKDKNNKTCTLFHLF